jgi:hypothetical protein
MTSLLDTITRDGGFTYDLASDRLLRVGESDGFMVAIPGTECLIGPADLTREDFAARFAAVARQAPNGTYVGGWLSPDRGFMIELSERFNDREHAVRLGVARHQEAILDLATGEFIATGGNGDGGTTAE